MERVLILAPALVGVAFLAATFTAYCVLCAVGRTPQVAALKHNQIFGPFLARYILWLLGPLERVLLGRVSANAITTASLLACIGAAVAVANGRLATAAWLYGLGGMFDLLDGRLARASGTQSPAGALFDSVSDRWAELALFTGYAWYLQGSPWLLAVMGAAGGSMMVSYTRARGEGLGLSLSGGAMQRAERVILVSVGTLVAAWLAAAPSTASYAPATVGVALAVCGVTATWTAIGRWIVGYRQLQAQARPPSVATPELEPSPAAVHVDAPAPAVVVPRQPMRPTGEIAAGTASRV